MKIKLLSIGEKIEKIRISYGYSKEKMAEILGFSGAHVVNSYRNIIKDKRKPSLKGILRIKSIHPGLNLNWLLFNQGEMSLDIDNEPDISILNEKSTEYLTFESQQPKYKDPTIPLAEKLLEYNRRLIKLEQTIKEIIKEE